jgi:alpha-beta hydrolase superfamily lysophospholipase
VGQLPSHCSLLLIHGTADEVLHVSNSEYIAALANVPKQLLMLQGAKHTLDEAAHDVHREVEPMAAHSFAHAESGRSPTSRLM